MSRKINDGLIRTQRYTPQEYQRKKIINNFCIKCIKLLCFSECEDCLIEEVLMGRC